MLQFFLLNNSSNKRSQEIMRYRVKQKNKNFIILAPSLYFKHQPYLRRKTLLIVKKVSYKCLKH